jgi:Flp pilus assembly protein TadB
MTTPKARAEGLRALASLLRAGLSPQAALVEWHQSAPPTLAPALRALSRRLTLGDTPGGAVTSIEPALGSEARTLVSALSVQATLGGDLAHVLDRLAAGIDRRAAAEQAGRAAAAGALLSGRVVAGLPLVMLLVAPLARAPLFDPAGVAMLAMGGGLAIAGLMWIGRLVPKPPTGDDDGAVFADFVASAVAGGAPLSGALEAAAEAMSGALEAPLARARRVVALGSSWPEALAHSGNEILAEIAAVIERGRRLGVPIADALEAHAARRRTDAANRFEAEIRRAPILMVLPLSFCVLPAYALLGLGPYLRGISAG